VLNFHINIGITPLRRPINLRMKCDGHNFAHCAQFYNTPMTILQIKPSFVWVWPIMRKLH